MINEITWLRISYWAGVIGDFAVAILVLIPERMGVLSYVHPMGLMSALAFSWGCMLIWADRKPLERKWILLPTILAGSTLLLAGIYSAYAGVITIRSIIPNIILYPTMIALWSFSYYNARDKQVVDPIQA